MWEYERQNSQQNKVYGVPRVIPPLIPSQSLERSPRSRGLRVNTTFPAEGVYSDLGKPAKTLFQGSLGSKNHYIVKDRIIGAYIPWLDLVNQKLDIDTRGLRDEAFQGGS